MWTVGERINWAQKQFRDMLEFPGSQRNRLVENLAGNALKDQREIPPIPAPEVPNIHVPRCLFPALLYLLLMTLPHSPQTHLSLPPKPSFHLQAFSPQLPNHPQMLSWSLLASCLESPSPFYLKWEGPGDQRASDGTWQHAVVYMTFFSPFTLFKVNISKFGWCSFRETQYIFIQLEILVNKK